MTTVQDARAAVGSASASASSDKLDGAAAAFGLAAALTIIFNSALLVAMDYWPAIDDYAAKWTGNVWRTHGLADILVYLVLGYMFGRRGLTIGGRTMAFTLFVSIVIAAGGLVLWAART